MKKIATIATVILIAASIALSASCSRQPSNKRAASIMQGFFKKYSKKYPESVIGQYPVENIDILHIDEIHKGLVAIYAILGLDGGMAIQTRFTIIKKPFAWRAVSWENMGVAMPQKPAE